MASRPRCSKRGSSEQDVGPASRKALGDISAHQNSVQPANRKYQKLCLSIDQPTSSSSSDAKQPPRLCIKTTLSVSAQAASLKISQVERVSTVGSDVEEQSSGSSPFEPAWLHSVPQKHRKTMEAMLRNVGFAISCREREVIVRDCRSTFQTQEHVDDFLEWMAAHDRVSSLTTRLCQTCVWSPITLGSSGPGNFYADDIYDNLLAREERFGIKPDYMETVQKDITHNMRSILVDWIVEVGEEYKLSSQTFFLAVNYIDRLLAVRSINRNKLQLVGITCMLVAAKYEEIHPPTIDEFVYISDNTYTRKDVLNMESILLSALQFKLSAPTAWEFARSFCCSMSIGDRPKFLAHFLTELFMMFPCCLKYRASMVAAAAVSVALHTLHLPPQPDGLMQLAGNNQDLFQKCVKELHTMHKKVISEDHGLKAIREKFQDAKWLRVSRILSRSLDTT